MPRCAVVVEVVADEPERYTIQGGRWNVEDEQFLGQDRRGYNDDRCLLDQTLRYLRYLGHLGSREQRCLRGFTCEPKTYGVCMWSTYPAKHTRNMDDFYRT